jgi:poly-gamma-glutamate synthesis protein (capsule biosynthesis protein)
VELLEKGGLQTIGNYNPRVRDDICEVIALPVRLQKSDKTEVKGNLPVAFCAWHYFEYDPEPADFEVMQRYANIMPVFAFVQVGTEYQAQADTKQVSIAHSLIDTGAPEFVIENSTHWVQNTEVYKGKLVVYSTGNFIFDQLDSETNRGLSIDTTMTLPYDDNVAKWLKIGDACDPRDDNCLEQAEEQGLKKVAIDLKYKAIGSSTGYRQVTQKADTALQKAIEARANWLDTLKALGQN